MTGLNNPSSLPSLLGPAFITCSGGVGKKAQIPGQPSQGICRVRGKCFIFFKPVMQGEILRHYSISLNKGSCVLRQDPLLWSR